MWVIILLKKLSAIFFALLFIFVVNSSIKTYAADCSAESAIVVDAKSMTVLYEKNAYEQRSIASTTKIMTALIALESGRLEETVTVNKAMLDTEGSSLGLGENDKISLYDLVVGMMLTSGNDAANAVAFFLSDSIEGFASEMNKRAEEIGMKNTLFVTPSGLDESNHHSTAFDMALLTAAAVKLDSFCKIVSMQKAEITVNSKKITVYNHNRLLSLDKNIFGVKTGFTQLAGRCLISAKKYNGNTLICVTLNAPDDWNDHLSLYKSCQKQYKKISVSNTVSFNAVGGEKEFFTGSYSGEYYILGEIKFRTFFKPFYYSPIKRGDKIGEVWVYNNNEIIERLPIEADEDVNYGSIK